MVLDGLLRHELEHVRQHDHWDRRGVNLYDLDGRVDCLIDWTHPGQYTVLNSEDPSARSAAIAELEVQAALLDAMRQPPDAVVVLHIGGAAGGTAAAADRFVEGFERLSERAQSRLAVETTTGRSQRREGRRVERRVVLPQLRAHADLVDPIGFEDFLRYTAGARDFDIMLEAKAKDLALLRLRHQLASRGLSTDDGAIRVDSGWGLRR